MQARPTTVLFAVLIALGAGSAGAAESENTKPNILVLYTDDMGYQDVGCYGSPVKTPNIDRLAGQGVRFTDFYAGAPNCSPSRAALLTGRIASRTGLYNYIPPEHGLHLPADEITIPERLREAGYATALFGKWHLSRLDDSPQPVPADYGFDYTFCTRNNAEPSHKDPVNFYRNGTPLGELEGYSCNLVARETTDWLKERAADAPPFFAYVAFHEPHRKLASPPDLVEQYREAGHDRPVYSANIANIDRAVGRILQTLEDLDLAEDTFVLFASDNGPWRDGSQGPLRGKKSDLWEGGIRVPGIMRWPGHIKPDTTSATPAGVVDMLPTLCAIAGVEPPRDRTIDGTDLTPLFRDETPTRDTPLFWYFYRVDPQVAMREGDWVLIGRIDDPVEDRTHWLASADMPFIKNSSPTRFELYNIREDIAQEHNVADQHPERLAAMKKAMIELHRDVVTEGDDWTEAIAGYERP